MPLDAEDVCIAATARNIVAVKRLVFEFAPAARHPLELRVAPETRFQVRQRRAERFLAPMREGILRPLRSGEAPFDRTWEEVPRP